VPNVRSLRRNTAWQAKPIYYENTQNNGTALLGKAFQSKAIIWTLFRQKDHTASACTLVTHHQAYARRRCWQWQTRKLKLPFSPRCL